jgi:hypothetical protein
VLILHGEEDQVVLDKDEARDRVRRWLSGISAMPAARDRAALK